MRLTEEEIRRITLNAINELGDKASPSLVRQVVSKAVGQVDTTKEISERQAASGRIILTSFGLNKPGVVASVTQALGSCKCDIQDISQKLMGDFFTMIMIIDISGAEKDLKEIQDELARVADEMKIKIYVQHEDIFRSMHRI